MSVWHDALGNPRHADGALDAMQGALLGPEFSSAQIKEFLDAQGCSYRELSDEEWAPTLARLIAD